VTETNATVRPATQDMATDRTSQSDNDVAANGNAVKTAAEKVSD
jgi:hypothetical protein